MRRFVRSSEDIPLPSRHLPLNRRLRLLTPILFHRPEHLMHQLSGLGGAGEDVFRDLDEEVGEVGVEVRPDHLAEIARGHTLSHRNLSPWGLGKTRMQD